MEFIPKVFPYLWPYWKLAITSVIVTILVALATLLAPWPLKVLVDNVLSGQPLPALLASLLGGLATDRYGLLAAVVFAGLGVTLLIGTLNVLNEYVHTR